MSKMVSTFLWGRLTKNTLKMNESGSSYGHFVFYRVQNFDFKKKLDLIEDSELASSWKCFEQHDIEESMEKCNRVLKCPLIHQWNDGQGTSRSMAGSDLQLVPIFY